MITITLIQLRPTGPGPVADLATAEFAGTIYEARSTHGATMALARKLVAAGCPDQPWEVPGRLRGKSLHRLAGLTMEEPKSGGLKMRRFVENSRFLRGGDSQDAFEDAEVNS